MVQAVAHSSSQIALPAENIPLWLQSISEGHTEEEVKEIHRAALYAIDCHEGQVRRSGEAYVNHTFAVAAIVHELGLDHEAIIAALLHDSVEDTDVTLDDLTKEFGASVAHMVNGVTKMEVINEFADDEHAINPETDDVKSKQRKQKEKEQSRVESLRKMMLAMVEDVRVVLIKLSDRLHNMRTMEHMPLEKQQLKSKETLDIFAPLANRLGVWQLKWELEDLAFRYLEPDTYKGIAKKLKHRRVDRNEYIDSFVDTLEKELEKNGVEADVKGRSKHIYSIWAKMQRKKLDFENVYDIRAVRILVDSVQECYAALGMVHTKWKYIPGEFDDYIATPKENNYQSIHTAVVGPEGRVIEIQIRTHKMHRDNELGVAAHWRYKEGGKSADSSLENKILWLRQLMEWKDDVSDANEFVERVQDDVFEQRIYVFTPKGRVIDLPVGATPIDFAYSIHTEVGNTCSGALVNGKMVTLTTELKTGQRVEVITKKNGKPSLDWLSVHHNCSLRLGKVSMAAAEMLHPEQHGKSDQKELFEVKKDQNSAGNTRFIDHSKVQKGVRAGGVDNLLVKAANCCLPIPGDDVLGFITKTSGISVHRGDCANIINLQEKEPARVIDVDWYSHAEQTYPMSVQIEAFDRKGLLTDITNVFSSEHVNVVEMLTKTNMQDQSVLMTVTAELPNFERMSQIINRLMQLPNISEVRRKK